MKKSITTLFKAAYGNYGIGAFKIFSAEQVQAVFQGAQQSQSPVIVQITPVARDYLCPEILDGMIRGAEKAYPDVVYCVHLDHGNRAHCLDAIESGFYSSVMIDASAEEFETNIAITKDIVDRAHAQGIAVEAELGVLTGIEDDITVAADAASYTDPDKAVEFVSRTGCDSLAVAIGTSHGAYKFSGHARLKTDILASIGKKLAGFPLVLHGASAVPMDEVAKINAAGGGLLMSASGVPDSQIKEAIELGVCKINIATDMRLIWARVHREFFKETPEKFDMVIPGAQYMQALSQFVAEKCALLGAIGHAS
ncbi:MAG: class II fructose-bisphosphate aldolase [Planctomycetes bacterium]|nr:class II fructose-bisphosphate aldolase [Planctomycetota bacterium]